MDDLQASCRALSKHAPNLQMECHRGVI